MCQPRTQRRPRLTGWPGEANTPRTAPPSTWRKWPQPVPQKLQMPVRVLMPLAPQMRWPRIFPAGGPRPDRWAAGEARPPLGSHGALTEDPCSSAAQGNIEVRIADFSLEVKAFG